MNKGVSLWMLAALFIFFNSWRPVERNKIEYACTPCGSACAAIHNGPGICKQCNMALVDKATIVHKNIQPDKMCSLNEKDVVFLDVRTPAEFNGSAEAKFGAIKSAINIPVKQIDCNERLYKPQ